MRGHPGATKEQIIEAAKASNAHDFIMSFPNGYDTQVGNKGTQLSGGQKQRIAIARVLVSNPQILLLDEATSALDSESEHIVQQALDKLLMTHRRTTIVIAHRLSTIRNASKIVFVKNGQVAETGTHDELMGNESGNYRRLVEEQEDTRQTDFSDMSSQLADKSSACIPAECDSTIELDEENSFDNDDHYLGNSYQLSFKNVSFSYPSRAQKQIFKDFCLGVRHGETLAVVGPSGGGKSTIFALIERFYDPNKGEVQFEGIDIKGINLTWLRNQIGYVEQEPTLFEGTIAENIKYGISGITNERVQEVAKIVDCHDFIMGFPHGYNTKVGLGGAMLSGGQKQRIAIARAIVRDPKILLLDESTSALDNQSESIVQEALSTFMSHGNATTIVIAHRLSTIRNADRIAFISDGQVKEVGSHNELMKKKKGLYNRLVKTQRDGLVVNQGTMECINEKVYDAGDESDVGSDNDSDTARGLDELNAMTQIKFLLKRARMYAQPDRKFIRMGCLGALVTGTIYPVWGVLFGLMIDLLFRRVLPCPGLGKLDPLTLYNFESCDEYYDSVATDMRLKSFELGAGFLFVTLSCLVGNTLLFWGFGTASERLNKRIRDSAFQSVIRQEVAYFDKHQIGTITSQLQNDPAKIHAFSIESFRSFTTKMATVFLGLTISMFFMWPFALLTLAMVPFMAFGVLMRMRYIKGTDNGDDEAASKKNVSSGIVLETLLNIRTVAALRMQEAQHNSFVKALHSENPKPFLDNLRVGATYGGALFINQWSNAAQIWWGGWLMFSFPGKYDFTSFAICMFCLKLSLLGLADNSAGNGDEKEYEESARRIFNLIDRRSAIDPLSSDGRTFS
mmetsp:Transcript_44923/g.67612  ORF Transcript_44923/g.67612 Transcript_44923/m.67612 type:complete len:850 (+) Transcript_44923:712-3261(+)